MRLLLVSGENDHILGLITAKDIQDEKPNKIAQESRIPHSAITVEVVMTPQSSIEVLDVLSMRNAQIGHIVATLRERVRQHALVVDPKTKAQCVRRIFSTSQFSKRLGVNAAEVLAHTPSLAEIGDDIC